MVKSRAVPKPHVAIVGAGPAGLYAAAALLEQRDIDARIDLFERLPTPWGLVRAGVSPDHPEKKLVIERQFDFTLKSPRLRYIGNVEIGRDISHDALRAQYDAIIYAVGAHGDVRMGVDGEDLPGSWSARQFVSWYNGHPDSRDLAFDLSCERAVIVGNGNVALDVARMLTRDVADLRMTDIADHALAALSRSAVREVVILGRRGERQAAYNSPELEEFLDLRDVDIAVEGADLADDAPLGWLEARKRDILRRLAARAHRSGNRRILFRFLSSPVRIEGDGKVERVVLGRNQFVDDGAGGTRIMPTGVTETLATGLVMRAIGYRGVTFPGLPFDDRRGVIRNDGGRVTDDAGVVSGVYTTGWIKRGCNGIIGSNKKCARQTVANLLDDLAQGRLDRRASGYDPIDNLLAACRSQIVGLRAWEAIDRAERAAGRANGRPRVKITEWSDLMASAFADHREDA